MSHLLFERDIRFSENIDLCVFFTFLFAVLAGSYNCVSACFTSLHLCAVSSGKCFSNKIYSSFKNVKNIMANGKGKSWRNPYFFSQLRNKFLNHYNKEDPYHLLYDF